MGLGSGCGPIRIWFTLSLISEFVQSPAQCRLYGSKWRIQLLAHFPQCVSLQIGPFDHNALQFRKFRDLSPQFRVPFVGLGLESRFPGSYFFCQLLVEEGWFGPHGFATQLVYEVTTGDQHDPCHQSGPSGIESIRCLPEPHEDVLYGILGFGLSREQLSGHLVDQTTELVVELLYGLFIAYRDAMHQHQVLLIHVLHTPDSPDFVGETLLVPYKWQKTVFLPLKQPFTLRISNSSRFVWFIGLKNNCFL